MSSRSRTCGRSPLDKGTGVRARAVCEGLRGAGCPARGARGGEPHGHAAASRDYVLRRWFETLLKMEDGCTLAPAGPDGKAFAFAGSGLFANEKNLPKGKEFSAKAQLGRPRRPRGGPNEPPVCLIGRNRASWSKPKNHAVLTAQHGNHVFWVTLHFI